MVDWTPLRWPAAWRDPGLLDLLSGTPVNCLVFDWTPAGPPVVLQQALQRKLHVVTSIPAGPDRDAAVRSAQSAGVSAIALEDTTGTSIPAIAWAGKSNLPWRSSAAGFVIADAVWPSVRASRSGEVEAMPTGPPWVDANGWSFLLARALGGGRPVWVDSAPPSETILRPEHYVLAAAEALAYGGNWVITLDGKVAAGLASRIPAAQVTWKALLRTLAFFGKHPDWRRMLPAANTGVLSDFTGPNEFLACELLNLLARQGVPYCVLEKTALQPAALRGLRCLIALDEQPPTPELLARVTDFCLKGGLLLAGSKFPAPERTPPRLDVYRRWKVYAVGQGRVALAVDEAPDPYLIAGDSQTLLSHRHDLVRIFNSPTLNVHYTETADRGGGVLHLINYATRPWGHPVSVVLAKRYKSARLWQLEEDAPSPLALSPSGTGVEIHLPVFDVYAAIQLSGGETGEA